MGINPGCFELIDDRGKGAILASTYALAILFLIIRVDSRDSRAIQKVQTSN